MSKAHDIILQQILEMLDAGTMPWDRPWVGSRHNRQRSVHGRPYRGINAVLTEWVAAKEGYKDPRWITFNQAKKMNGAPRKGEKSLAITLWKPTERTFTNDDGSSETKNSLYLTYYRVFNVEQCDGLDLTPLPTELAFDWDPLNVADDIVYGYLVRGGGPMLQHGSDGAWYKPSQDLVSMPTKTSFPEAASYYTTLFHELTHSTGHKDRLGRRGIESVAAFGSEVYSQEELVAELGAAFLAGEAGLSAQTIERSASYIDNWRKALTDDPKLIITAAGAAQKAVDHILAHQSDEPMITNGAY